MFENVFHRYLLCLHLEVPVFAHRHVLVPVVETRFLDLLDEHVPVAVCEVGFLQVVEVLNEAGHGVEDALEGFGHREVLDVLDLPERIVELAVTVLDFSRVRVREPHVLDLVENGERQ